MSTPTRKGPQEEKTFVVKGFRAVGGYTLPDGHDIRTQFDRGAAYDRCTDVQYERGVGIWLLHEKEDVLVPMTELSSVWGRRQ